MMTSFILSALLFSGSLIDNPAATETGLAIYHQLSVQLDSYAYDLRFSVSSPAGCANAYSALYAKDTLAISVFAGFSESAGTNFVLDRPFASALIDHLKRDCPENYFACGFSALDGDSTRLTKAIEFDSQQKKIILLNVFSSAVSEDYTACRIDRAAEQRSRSDFVSREYLSALTHDDIVLYVGHSRYGTGPGFRPLPFFSSEGLQALFVRPVLEKLCQTLEQSPTRPAILGFVSCRSQTFYARKIHQASPRSALLLTSENTPHQDNFRSVLGFLNSILGRHCRDTALKSINPDHKTSDFSFRGFFRESPHLNYKHFITIPEYLMAIMVIALVIMMCR